MKHTTFFASSLKTIIFLLLGFPLLSCAMGGNSSNSDSQKFFENSPFIFTRTNSFPEQKKKAFDLIANLTSKTVVASDYALWRAMAAAFIPNTPNLLIASRSLVNAKIKLRTVNIETNTISETIISTPSTHAAFSADGLYLITKDNQRIKLFNAATGDFIRDVTIKENIAVEPESFITFKPNVSNPHKLHIALAKKRTYSLSESTIIVIEVETGEIVNSIHSSLNASSIAFNINGSLVAILGSMPGQNNASASELHVINTSTGDSKLQINFDGSPKGVTFSSDGFIAVLLGNLIHIIDTKTDKIKFTIQSNDNSQTATSYNAIGSLLAVEFGKGEVRIFNIEQTERIVNTLSLAHYYLLEALTCAARDTKPLPNNQRARIHADKEKWETWLSLKKLLPEVAIKRLEPYITRSQSSRSESDKDMLSSTCSIQ